LLHQVLNCIGDLFGGATAIQDWLVTSARFISRLIPADRLEHAARKDQKKYRGVIVEEQRVLKELMTSVIWTTPLSLPVVQPYRKPVRKQVSVIRKLHR
jgi:DNA-directed RNA polymerase, mitochondrial